MRQLFGYSEKSRYIGVNTGEMCRNITPTMPLPNGIAGEMGCYSLDSLLQGVLMVIRPHIKCKHYPAVPFVYRTVHFQTWI